MKKRTPLFVAAALSVLLASCGGGDSATAPAAGTSCTDLINKTADQAALVAAINAARAQPRTCWNGGVATQYSAVPPLKWNTTLADLAQAHSVDMAQNNYFEHADLNGKKPADRAEAAGYGRYVGENIAAGGVYQWAQQAVDAWLASSSGHCDNIMHPEFRDYGLGCAINSKSTYTNYWTQEFGKQ